MEPKPRIVTDIIADNDQEREARGVVLIAEVERLEAEHGINYEQLVAIYGDKVLDAESTASTAIERWTKLCDTLRHTDKLMVALASTRLELVPGCYGFGAKEEYERKTDIIIVTNPHEAAIRFENHDTKTAFIEATGYQLRHPVYTMSSRNSVEFDDLSLEPSDIKTRIAYAGRSSGNTSLYPAGDMMQFIVTGDSFFDLYEMLKFELELADTNSHYTNRPHHDDIALMTLMYAQFRINRKARQTKVISVTNDLL